MSVGTSVRILTLPPSTVATTVKILTLPSSKARTGSKFWRYLRPRTQTGSKFWRYLRPRTRVGSKFWRYLRPGRKQVQNFDATCDHGRIVEGFKVEGCRMLPMWKCCQFGKRARPVSQKLKYRKSAEKPAICSNLLSKTQFPSEIQDLNSHLRNYGVKK